MAKKSAPSTVQAPIELQALEQTLRELDSQIGQLEQRIRAATRAAEVERDGFDRYQPGLPAEMLQMLARDGAVAQDRLDAFAAWRDGPLAELQSQLKALQAQRAEMAQVYGQERDRWRKQNAEGLQRDVQAKIEALRQRAADLTGKAKELREQAQRGAAVEQERATLQVDHDHAVAQALAAGEPLPPTPAMPAAPAVSPAQAVAAAGIVDQQIIELEQQIKSLQSEHEALGRIAASRRADGLFDSVLSLAAEQAVPLSELLNRLRAKAGPGMTEMMARDGELRALGDLKHMRAEVERLMSLVRAANQRLERHGLECV